jgi:hypothetical protein
MGPGLDLKVKKRFFLQLICEVAVIAGLFASRPSYSAAKLAVFGDIRGHVEPCGCDPRTDLGGVRRIGAALVRYRGLFQDLIVVGTGNFQEYGKDLSETSKVLSPALEAIGPDVVLLNQLELTAVNSDKALPNLPWLLSNYVGKPHKVTINPIVTKNGTEFFGVLAQVDRNLESVDPGLLNRMKKMTKVQKSDQRVLVFSGSVKKLPALVASGFFGHVILSNPTKYGVEIGDQERSKESTLLFSLPGKIMGYAVPFGGAGLLRLGGLELKEFPKTIAAIAGSQDMNTTRGISFAEHSNSGAFNALPRARLFHWLDISEESAVPDVLLKLTDAARSKEKETFKLLATIREKDLPSTEFAGANSCESCHKSAYEIWTKTKHASAMATLVMKQRQEDPPCVECHVLGFTKKGGYVSEEKSPNFSNVQCESCHGPRKAHVANPAISPQVKASETCAVCHTPPHSPGFEYKSYWHKIEHK